MSKERFEQWGFNSYKDNKTGIISDDFLGIMNQQSQRIAELEEQLKNATHKFNIYQEVYYLDYKYKFEPNLSKYLAVCKGKILDIILREEGCVEYNFTFDDLKWISEDNVFATEEEAQEKLKELKGE